MKKEVGEEEGKGNGTDCSPEREHLCWVPCAETFLSLVGEVSGEGFS